MIFCNKDSNGSVFFEIENTIFFDIIGDDYYDLIHIEGEKIIIFFDNLQISLIGFFSNILYIESENGNFSMNSSIFFENYPAKNVLSLGFLFSANITQTAIQYTNLINGEPFFQGGGNILLLDCLMKSIEKLEISYSFSSTTTIGLKIIDHADNKMNNPKVIYFF